MYVLYPFAVALFFIWMFVFNRGQRIACPDCNQLLPLFQSPTTKTRRQWWEGGYTCQNCGCETDMAGRKVAAGMEPQRSSVVRGIGFLVLALVPAIALLLMVNQHHAPLPAKVAPPARPAEITPARVEAVQVMPTHQ